MRFVPALACAAGFWSAAASGQSIDPTQARAIIGVPLDLEVQVRTTPDLGAARLDRSCIQAQVRDGDRLIDDRALTIDIGPATDEGHNRLHIRHAVAVNEPIVQASVSLTCGANFTREFTVLSQAGNQMPDTPKPGTTGRLKPRRSASSATPTKAVRASVPEQQASSPSGPAQAGQAGTSVPEGNTTTVDSRPGSGEIDALARSVLRLLQAAGLDLQRSSQGMLDLRRPDAVQSLAAADSKYLLQEVQRLRSESQQSATALASLHARVDRAEGDRWLHATWTVFAVIAVLVTLAIAVRVTELAAPALLRRFPRRVGDVDRPGTRQVKPGSSMEQYLNDIGARPPTTQIERTVAPPAAPEAMGLAFDEAELLAPDAITVKQIQAASSCTTTQAKRQSNRWAHAEFGPPSLDHRRLRPHRNDIDKAIQDGYLGFALVMLEQLLHSGDGKHPWVLLRLLDVYRDLHQQDNHERVCAEIEALYNVRATGYIEQPGKHNARDTFDQLEDWPELRSAWPNDNASSLIASCLLRGDRQTDWDLATFADLLFLHELAEIRDAPQELRSSAV